MLYKYMLAAVLGLSMAGCAVYGAGYGYGYRGYDRHYSSNHYQVQRYPVYMAPRHHKHAPYRYERRQYHQHAPLRYDRRHYDQRRYLPAPPARFYRDDRRAIHRIEGRRDYRSAQPRRGWHGQHLKPDQRTPRYRRWHDGRRDEKRRDGRRRQK